jgi:hypothetical protein
MASGIYNRFKANLMNKEVDLEADTIRIILLSGSHAFTATHNTYSQISSNEITGTGYTVSGQALSSKTVTQAASTLWDASDATWSGSTFTASHAAIYDDTTTNDDLICSIDFGGSQTIAGGTFSIQFHTSGIIALA